MIVGEDEEVVKDDDRPILEVFKNIADQVL